MKEYGKFNMYDLVNRNNVSGFLLPIPKKIMEVYDYEWTDEQI